LVGLCAYLGNWVCLPKIHCSRAWVIPPRTEQPHLMCVEKAHVVDNRESHLAVVVKVVVVDPETVLPPVVVVQEPRPGER
jgi:hypothetical protein